MVEKGSVIKTGVDRLLDVLRTDGTVSVKAAAVKLGVSTAAVLDWAKLLEEENLVKIKYRFATAYLEGKNLNTPEYQKVKKELIAEKDLLDQKLEGTSNYLEALENEVQTLKDVFGEIGKHVGSNMSKMKNTLNQLQQFESKKEDLDKQIVAGKSRYVERIEALNKRLGEHQGTAKQWYERMYGEVMRGGELIELEQHQLTMLDDNEKMLERQLADMRGLLDVSVINKMSENKPEAEKLRKTLIELRKRYITMKEEAEAEKGSLLKLIIENEKNLGEIEKVQKEIVSKMQASSEDFGVTKDDLKGYPKKLEELFSKKNLVETILSRLHFNEIEFKKRLGELKTRSTQASKISSLEKFKDEIKVLELDVAELAKKREYFTKEMKNLVSLLRK